MTNYLQTLFYDVQYYFACITANMEAFYVKIHRHIRSCLLITYMLFCWFISPTLLHNTIWKFRTFFQATRYLSFLPVRRCAIVNTSHSPVSVCLSLCHKLEFYRNGWTNRAGFWHGSLKGNLGVSKNNGTSLWNFVPNSRRRKFCFGVSIFEKCYRLSLTMWTLRAW